MQTILHINNPHVEAFRNAGASLTQLLNNHFVSNYTVSDVQVRSDLDPAVMSISIDPIAPEDPEQGLPAIVFDASENVIQHLTNSNYHNLRSEQPNLFPAPVVEPEPEPRYKKHMTEAEFVRDLITKEEWAAIGALANADANVWAWAYTTSAGEVWVEHPDFEAGLQLGVSLSVWNEARADEIRKGLLIT